MLKLGQGVVLDPPAPAKKMEKVEPKTYFIQKTIGSDTYLVMAQSAIELEDEFSSLYYTASNQNNLFLEPPFDPQVLLNLVVSNNILNQCVEVMEVNVDGTGHDFVKSDEEVEIDPDEEKIARSFFEEPCPGLSSISIRRKLRGQLESIGYSFLEVLRNAQNDIMGFRNVETHHLRMVKLDTSILVEKKVMRNGQEVTLKMWDRERKFAQRVALKTLVFYKEFGVERHVDRNTGRWETKEQPILPMNRATELILFGIHPDVRTPYFVPRWINQMPSVIGSRKAEEQNLEFLDSGGMPPAIIFIQGGVLGKDAADQLRMYLSGKNKNKQRAVVVEATSSSGSMDAAGTVQVKVERFGAEKAQDAMFMKYDVMTEDHVRVGFRIPTLFLGKQADYNFATAQTAYMVAEAQVFQPERSAFDEKINATIVRGLGLKTLKLQSKPITLKDVANQMTALGIAKDLASRESMLDTINDITGLKLELGPEPQPDAGAVAGAGGAAMPPHPPGTPGTQVGSGRFIPGQPPAPIQPKQPELPPPTPIRGQMSKPHFQSAPPDKSLPGNPANPPKPKPKKTAQEMIDLAHQFAMVRGLVRKGDLPEARALQIRQAVAELEPEEQGSFTKLLSVYSFGRVDPDLQLIAGWAASAQPYVEAQ